VPPIGDDFVAHPGAKRKLLPTPPYAARVVPEFDLDHIRELIHAPFRVVYLRQAKESCSYASGEVRGQLELPANANITRPCPGCQKTSALLRFCTGDGAAFKSPSYPQTVAPSVVR